MGSTIPGKGSQSAATQPCWQSLPQLAIQSLAPSSIHFPTSLPRLLLLLLRTRNPLWMSRILRMMTFKVPKKLNFGLYIFVEKVHFKGLYVWNGIFWEFKKWQGLVSKHINLWCHKVCIFLCHYAHNCSLLRSSLSRTFQALACMSDTDW